MTYTFWHSGILIGDSDLDETSDNPGQRAGIFQPTPYGLGENLAEEEIYGPRHNVSATWRDDSPSAGWGGARVRQATALVRRQLTRQSTSPRALRVPRS